MNDDLSSLRIDYEDGDLRASTVGDDPMVAFRAWFDAATVAPELSEPNAMSFATAAADGTPSVRMVLLKAIDDRRAAFSLYTNLDSRKAREALLAKRAALCWWWPATPARQVRVVGRVELVERSDVDRYFASRPLAARIGAAASEQSRPLADRSALDARAAAIDPSSVHVPEHWGGIRVVADEIELWQGRAGRLHDRLTFLRLDDDGAIASRAGADAAGGDERLVECGTVVHDAHGTSWLRARLAP